MLKTTPAINLVSAEGNQILYDDGVIRIEQTPDNVLVGLKNGMEVGKDDLLEVCQHLFDEDPRAEYEKTEIKGGEK